jgi:hypothetical protein
MLLRLFHQRLGSVRGARQSPRIVVEVHCVRSIVRRFCRLESVLPQSDPYRYAIFDHDSKLNVDVINLLTSTGLQPKRTSIQAPWQNGIAERWIGSCRREMLDHIIPLNERHLRRLLREYARYHNDYRIHDALNKDAPKGRLVEQRSSPAASILRWTPSFGQKIDRP